MPQQTSWQRNAGEFATTAAAAVDAQRHLGVHQTLQALHEGNPSRALYTLTRSVQRQARMAGLGDLLPVPCPCGGRCRR
jgi:hypothetical protein